MKIIGVYFGLTLLAVVSTLMIIPEITVLAVFSLMLVVLFQLCVRKRNIEIIRLKHIEEIKKLRGK